MPRSWLRSSSETAAAACRRVSRSLGRLRRDEQGVSEAVGYSLTFGILAAVLVISLYTFQQNQEETVERVSELHGESVAQRVASAVVRASILVEERQMTSYRHLIALDEQVEGRNYDVSLEEDGIVVDIGSRGVTISEPLFGAHHSVELCQTTVPGGPIYISYGPPPAGSGCTEPTMLYLEEA